MEWSWPESVSFNRQRVVEELVQGREQASQLRRVLDHKSSVPVMNGGDVIRLAEGLVNKIMGSLANTLLILNGKDQSSENHREIISYNQLQFSTSSTFNTSIMSTTGCVDSSSEDSKESRKTTSTFKDSRGSYKRRKSSQYSWSRDSPTWTDDAHGWRKYGQKIILNEKHTRNYYRCTNKFDQGCQATKYVQKTQDDPPVFRTTYYGNHSCRDSLKASDELVVDYCTSPRESSKFISFHATNKQEHPFFNSFTSFKNELIIEDEIIPAASLDHHVTTHHDHHSSDHYLASDDLTAFEFSGPMTGFSSTMGQLLDREDVISAMIEEYSHVL